jgi:uncharacterized membrane protein YphA (DoxX/SURF4 family)
MREECGKMQWLMLRLVVAVIFLTAASLKAWQLATVPSLGEGLLNARWFNILVVELELFFGIWLIVGMLPKLTWLATIGCFSVFALVSLYKALSGETSCGCLGVVTVNPWNMMVFDLVIVGCLLAFRVRGDWKLPPLDRKKVLAVLIAWLVLAGLALSAMLSLKQQPHATLGVEYTAPDGRKMILLEPEIWVGKAFPLAARFVEPHEGAMLKKGDWLVLFIHTDCPDCKQMMVDLERQKTQRVAIVVVPSRSGDKMPSTSFPMFVLDNQTGWFATTPCVVKLSDGICVTVSDKLTE